MAHDGQAVTPGVVLFVSSDHVDGDYGAHVEALRVAGYLVEVAPTAVEALRRGASVRPDVLIIPLLMPDMSGSDLAHRMGTSDGHTLAVVILGPNNHAGAEPDGPVTAGATFCALPCPPTDLVAVVGRQLTARSIARGLQTLPDD